MKNLQNNTSFSAFPGPSTKVGGGQNAPWPLHFFEIILLPQRVSRKFTCVLLLKASKILLVPPLPILVGCADVN